MHIWDGKKSYTPVWNQSPDPKQQLITVYFSQMYLNYKILRFSKMSQKIFIETSPICNSIEEYCILGYIVLFDNCFHAGFFLGLFFDSEDGGDMFLRNVG
jgi:hypothetical protein